MKVESAYKFRVDKEGVNSRRQERWLTQGESGDINMVKKTDVVGVRQWQDPECAVEYGISCNGA